MLLNKKCKGCNSCYKPRELEHMPQLPMTMRSVIRSHRTTWTSLIIVVRLHAFKTAAQFLSALAEKFQLRRKARRARSRLGLVGWIAYWSLGNSALALKIVVALIRKLDMTDSVFEALTPIAMTREADTNAKIVMLMKAALAETKHCRNEQQRQEFHIGLSYVMPPREGERSSKGWIRRICETHHGHLWLC